MTASSTPSEAATGACSTSRSSEFQGSLSAVSQSSSFQPRQNNLTFNHIYRPPTYAPPFQQAPAFRPQTRTTAPPITCNFMGAEVIMRTNAGKKKQHALLQRHKLLRHKMNVTV